MTQPPDPLKMRRESELELLLYTQIEQARLPLPEWQYQINGTGHKWDFAWALQRLPLLPDRKILVEVQGGTRGLGHHSREPGYSEDRKRANRAQLDGWMVLEFTSGQVNDGTALDMIEEALL